MKPGPDGRLRVEVRGDPGPIRDALADRVEAHPLLASDPGAGVVLAAPGADLSPEAELRIGLGPGEGSLVLPESGPDAVYRRPRLRSPGAIATALALALLPLAGRLSGRVPCFAVGGALKEPAPVGPYRVLVHPDAEEVERLVGGVAVDLVPFAAPVGSVLWAIARLPHVPGGLYAAWYAGNPLVHLLDRPPTADDVAMTDRAAVGLVHDESATVVIVAVDRLGRGSAGQAIALLNLAMGWPVDLGLR